MIRISLIGVLVLYATGAIVDNMISKYKNMGAPLFIILALVLIRDKRTDIIDDDYKLPITMEKDTRILARKNMVAYPVHNGRNEINL